MNENEFKNLTIGQNIFYRGRKISITGKDIESGQIRLYQSGWYTWTEVRHDCSLTPAPVSEIDILKQENNELKEMLNNKDALKNLIYENRNIKQALAYKNEEIKKQKDIAENAKNEIIEATNELTALSNENTKLKAEIEELKKVKPEKPVKEDK